MQVDSFHLAFGSRNISTSVTLLLKEPRINNLVQLKKSGMTLMYRTWAEEASAALPALSAVLQHKHQHGVVTSF